MTRDSTSSSSSFWSNYKLSNLTRSKNAITVMQEVDEDERAFDAAASDLPSSPDNKSMAKSTNKLTRTLGVWDVISYGISASVGAGVFVTTGTAALSAGPAVMLSYVLASSACLLSAFCYCEFAVRVPVAGSAYTFTYVCLGEAAAWFIGWNLTLEYAISAAAIARGWSGHIQLLLHKAGVSSRVAPDWLFAVRLGSVVSDASLMSIVILALCTLLLLRGVHSSARVSSFFAVLNVCLITFIVALGAMHVRTSNWFHADIPADTPVPVGCSRTGSFMPCGINGVLTGAAQSFFAYVGFDSVTCLAEEVTNPKRDMPVGILGTLFVATALYVGASGVVTGMQPWYALERETPLASAFSSVGVEWAGTLIAITTVTALSATTLAALFGQPRIFYRMAKDGLLFKQFGQLVDGNPRFGTVVTGVAASAIAFIADLDQLSTMISIGTLLAFTTVCAGVVIIRYAPANAHRTDIARIESNTQQRRDGEMTPPERSYNDDEASSSAAAAARQLHESFLNHDAVARSSGYAFASSSGRRSFSFAYYAAACYNSVLFWLTLYIVLCFGFATSIIHSDSTPVIVNVLLGTMCLIPILRISILPQHASNLPPPEAFTCPFVPLLPMLSILFNIFLIASCDLASYARIAIWSLLGFAVYFMYGIHHSRLNFKSNNSNINQHVNLDHLMKQ